MKILINREFDEYDGERQHMYINDKSAVTVQSLFDCPEDACIGRDLVSCIEIADFMKLAYDAGIRGEPFELLVEDPPEE